MYTIFFSLMAFLILKFGWLILKSKMMIRKSNKLGKGIDNIYRKLAKNQNFDVENFIKNHGEEVINLFSFTEYEIQILREKFCMINKID